MVFVRSAVALLVLASSLFALAGSISLRTGDVVLGDPRIVRENIRVLFQKDTLGSSSEQWLVQSVGNHSATLAKAFIGRIALVPPDAVVVYALAEEIEAISHHHDVLGISRVAAIKYDQGRHFSAAAVATRRRAATARSSRSASAPSAPRQHKWDVELLGLGPRGAEALAASWAAPLLDRVRAAAPEAVGAFAHLRAVGSVRLRLVVRGRAGEDASLEAALRAALDWLSDQPNVHWLSPAAGRGKVRTEG